jgi:hypothetical protein
VEARRDGGRGGVPRVSVLPYFRDPKPPHGEEYNGQGELNGQGEHKSIVLWRRRSRLFGPWLAVDHGQELC